MSASRGSSASVGWIAGLAGAVGLAALAAQFGANASFAADAQSPPAQAAPTAAAPAPAAPAPAPPAPAALAPMTDTEWKKNSGSGTLPERYQIIKGDTLWGISKRFFGDGMAWPKLYESNKDTISNPNLIYPNKWVVFVPGTGTSLPKLTDQGTAPPPDRSGVEPSGPDAPKEHSKKTAASTDKISSASAMDRSEEWKLLPRQSWEVAPVTIAANADTVGFEKGSKLQYGKAKQFDLEAISASDRLPTLGQIVGGRSGAMYLSLGDTVYIRADEDIQLGVTYAVTQEPDILKSRKSDRQGFSYLILGQVKIIGVRDDLFVGTIVSAQDVISRGSDIIVSPPKVQLIDPVPATLATEGVLMTNKHFSTFYTAQHKLIFIDRGSADGVKLGNVFRAYEHYDLSNDKKITSSDFIIDADAMVVQVSEKFCTATIINSIVPVTEDSAAVLLTDVSDLNNKSGFRGSGPENKQGTDELDELDKLDNGSGMGKDEQKELQQLENWKGNPQSQPTPGAPSASSPGKPGNEEVAPPPPPPPPGEAKPEELSPPPPAPENPPALPSESEAMPPPPPPSSEEAPPAPAAPAQSTASKISPAPAEPPPPPPPPPPSAPPPAPGAGGSQAPTDESKALDQLLNQ